MLPAIETSLQRHLHALAVAIGSRPTGSEANRRAEESFFDPPPTLAEHIRRLMPGHPHLTETAPWPQGDHSIFWQRGVPAVAITTAGAWELVGSIIHSENDTVERVSAASLAEVVAFVADILAAGQP
ncbi:MAG: hypothetical protein K1X65_09085 [Caldilineales bacterium]|nr:hypothetical protein [Caldilineales bacterium]